MAGYFRTKMKPNDFPFKNVSSSFEFRNLDTSVMSDIIKKLELKMSTDISMDLVRNF